VHERGHPGARGGLEHPARAVDVDGSEHRRVTRRLDQPRQVDDGVGAGEHVLERARDDVGLHPARARIAPTREPASDADDLLDGRITLQRGKHAGAHVARCPGHDDAHAVRLPG
jgi:hypothetical protein